MNKWNFSGYLLVSVLGMLMLPKAALGFGFWDSGKGVGYLDASSIPNTLGSISSGYSTFATRGASGYPDTKDGDYVTVSGISVSTAMTSRGFNVQFSVSNGSCVWPDTSCKHNYPYSYPLTQETVGIRVRLTRNSTAAYDPIPSGTPIGTVSFRQYSTWGGGATSSVSFYTRGGAVTPVVPTCDVKSFDETVTLPKIMNSDLTNSSIGRYPAASKDFNIHLACSDSPKVSVKFDGTKMAGITDENVLANLVSGNDNVGVQLVFNDNAIKLGEFFEVINSAGETEDVKFNAHYYYKGGAVNGGKVKSQAEFLFNYK